MKIAIFHPYFGAVGGGERFVIDVARMVQADIITTDVEPEVIHSLGADNLHFVSLGSTWKIPGMKQISASWLFARADVRKKYDLFLFFGDWTLFAAKRHKPNLYYCFTPTRVFYDLYERFVERQGVWKRILFQGWVGVHRQFLERRVKEVTKIVCISKTVQKRIENYWGKKVPVVYPFVADNIKGKIRYGDFWLAVNRLYPEKRVDLQIEVFRQMSSEKLVIVGGVAKGDHAEGYASLLRKNLPSNVVIKSTIRDEELAYLYRSCRGVLATAYDEDFGLTPLEAFSYGKPVVVTDEGGYRETVIEGKTGKRVRPDVQEIMAAVQWVGKKPERFRKACLERASVFSRERFYRLLKKELRGIRNG